MRISLIGKFTFYLSVDTKNLSKKIMCKLLSIKIMSNKKNKKMYLDVSFLVIQTSVDFRFTSSYCSVHLHYGRCYSMLKY